MDVSGLESACLGDVGTLIHTPNTVCAARNWALYRSALMSAPVWLEKNGGGGRGQ